MANTGKSTSKLNILYGEGDAEVLAAQAVSIQKAGHQVVQAIGREGVQEALQRGAFDLVVLGPTLTRNDRHHLPYMVRKAYPGTRVLVMHTDGERHPQVDANLETGRSIDDLVAKIAVMQAQDKEAVTQ
jgi:DNA-binding NtrC family response regulator